MIPFKISVSEAVTNSCRFILQSLQSCDLSNSLRALLEELTAREGRTVREAGEIGFVEQRKVFALTFG